MYKHARQKPRNGLMPQGSGGMLDDGPSPEWRAQMEAHRQRLAAEREANRERARQAQRTAAP